MGREGKVGLHLFRGSLVQGGIDERRNERNEENALFVASVRFCIKLVRW